MNSRIIKKLIKAILKDIVTKVLPIMIGLGSGFYIGLIIMSRHLLAEAYNESWFLGIIATLTTTLIGCLIIAIIGTAVYSIYMAMKKYIMGRLQEIRRSEQSEPQMIHGEITGRAAPVRNRGDFEF